LRFPGDLCGYFSFSRACFVVRFAFSSAVHALLRRLGLGGLLSGLGYQSLPVHAQGVANACEMMDGKSDFSTDLVAESC